MRKFILLVVVMLSYISSIQGQDSISYKDMYRKEVDFIISTLKDHSIDYKRGLTQEEWEKRSNDLYAKIDSCSEYDYISYYYALRYAGPLIKDVHGEFPDYGVYSYYHMFQSDDIIFPIWTKTFSDHRLFVAKDYSGHLTPNAEILTINGHSAQALAKRCNYLSYGEEPYIRQWVTQKEEGDGRASITLTSYLFIEGIHHPFHISYRDYGSNEIKEITLDGIRRGDRFEEYKESGDKKNVERLGRAVEYTKTDDSIGTLRIKSLWGGSFVELFLFRRDYRYPRQLNSAMRKLRKHAPENLIVDIRGNGGGYGDNIFKTLAYFYEEPIHQENYYHITSQTRSVAREVLQQGYKAKKISTSEINKALQIFDSLPDGSFMKLDTLFSMDYKPKVKAKKIYKGDIYLLTDAGVYSAGILFARYFHQYGIGKIAGEAPGGFQQVTSGNSLNIELPHSKSFKLRIPFGLTYKPTDDIEYSYIQPDIPIEETLDSWLNNKDNVMQTLIQKINNKE